MTTIRKTRVVVFATHPIQYQVPWFRALAKEDSIELVVVYFRIPDAEQQGVGFDIAFTWDVPLLGGYEWRCAPLANDSAGLRGYFSLRVKRPSQLLRELSPDVILLTGWQSWAFLQLLICARRLGIPVLMRGESNALRQRPLAIRALHRLLLSQCSAFLAIGKANREFYLRNGVPEEKIFDGPYFVDNHRFSASAGELAPQRTELRARWRIPADAVCFCFVGKLEPKKRILDLLQALDVASREPHARFHLLVVGSGELMGAAQRFAAARTLPVTFAGFLNQTGIPAAYVAADCLVLPSDAGETWGLVVNEAMACGKPAIVSNEVGCAADLVDDGKTGYVFPVGNIDALARLLVAASRSPANLRAMGESARARVVSSYSVEQATSATLGALARLRSA